MFVFMYIGDRIGLEYKLKIGLGFSVSRHAALVRLPALCRIERAVLVLSAAAAAVQCNTSTATPINEETTQPVLMID